MNPILYRYRDSESVIKHMDGYTPGEGWEPLYSQDQISSAVNAALEATAPASIYAQWVPPMQAAPIEGSPNEYLAYTEGWNHCVRAMLAASESPATAPERKPMPILEVNARWEQSVLGITRLQYYQVIREVEAFHGIKGGKP